MIVTLQAVAWGLDPIGVANKSYEVNDQIAYEASVLQSVVQSRAPIKGRIRVAFEGEGPTLRATVSATLTDEEGGEEVTYRSPRFADIPIKNSPLWKSDPEQQLWYFSVRSFARRHFPDILMGVYEREEAAAIDLETGQYREVEPVKVIGARMDQIADRATQAKAAGADPETGEIREPAKAETKEPEPAQTAAPPEPTEEAPKRRGRPAGSKNRPKEDPAPAEPAKPVEPEVPESTRKAREAADQMDKANGVAPVDDIYEALRDESDSWPDADVAILDESYNRNLRRFGINPDDDGSTPGTEEAGAVAPSPQANDPIAIAYNAGVEAKKLGMSRKASPGEYRVEGREAEMASWWKGWDETAA